MAIVTHPNKQTVHDWMTRTRDPKQPLQTLEQIRKTLGWYMLPNNLKKSAMK